MEDYKKKYEDALERARTKLVNEVASDIFPELAESEDERIRKALMQNLKERFGTKGNMGEGLDMPDVLVWLEKQGEQKSADKVKPKFKAGDWAVSEFDKKARYISEVHNDEYNSYYVINEMEYNIDEYDRLHHLWTIQDAKDGDVLSYVTYEEDLWVMIYWSLYEPYEGHVHYHALLVNNNFGDKGTCCICVDNLKPATKEQRDLLFAKMKEAGYEWNAEKKELKKIEQKPANKIEPIFNVGDKIQYSKGCGTIMTIEKIENDEYIFGNNMGHTTIESGNKWYLIEQKPAWSEEDKKTLERIIMCIENHSYMNADDIHWLKSIKDRVQPKQEWSEEDEITRNALINLVEMYYGGCIDKSEKNRLLNFLKSLRPQNTWKPSDEQMKALKEATNIVGGKYKSCLNSLYSDLKKLRGE